MENVTAFKSRIGCEYIEQLRQRSVSSKYPLSNADLRLTREILNATKTKRV